MRRIPLLLLATVLLVACGPGVQPTLVPTPVPTSEPVPTPGPAQSVRPTFTKGPTRTPAPTDTPTATPTRTKVPTYTPKPTKTITPTPLSEAEVAATATAEALAVLVSPKGNGFYLVGVDIAPGKWHSTGTGRSCYWARRDANQEILDNHFGLAGGTVTLRATDYEVEFSKCGTWEYVENAERVLRDDAADPKGDGFYTVGVEIVPGRWRSKGTEDGCYWARLDGYQDTIDNHYGAAGGTVTIREGDYEVVFDGCGEWEYLGP